MFKDLLVHIDRGAAAQHRLEVALTLAERFEAHLTALYLVPEPFVPAIVGMPIPADLLQEQLAQAEREADQVLAAAREAGQRRGIALTTRRETGMLDRLPVMLARQVRHADLVIMGQPDPDVNGVDDALLVEAAFMDSGRPALVIPYIGAHTMPPRRIIVAWDGSREAARAANDALPFLRLAQEVTVLVVDANERRAYLGEQPGADMAAHLARHGVRVEVRQAQSGGLGIGDVILSTASDEGADLLVMGGYGHSRLREMIVGGVTRHLLEHMTVPVLLSH
ncbi:universal stress protein [Benzoatithermus flavus]|uniref:Universal stress protein n=1 Tax=Benzoatithermus flavus TaxID=3108223 RepID=A0ABU8XNF8_9PROT